MELVHTLLKSLQCWAAVERCPAEGGQTIGRIPSSTHGPPLRSPEFRFL